MVTLKFSLFLAIFVTLQLSDVKSEFVTLWTPKFVQEDAIYRLSIFPTDITKDTEVAVQFRSANASYTMANKKIGAVEYGSKQRNFGNITSFDLTMTLLRNVSTSSGTQMHCSTKKISVETKTGNFYNFIQTDKPIYKPGDEVQFRVLTVDKDLLPFHRNSINVTITDPAGRTIYNFKNQEGKYIGVFDDKFTLSTDTTLGDWLITVIVDKKEHMAQSKLFAVQKYTLPLFDPQIDLPEVHVLKDADMLFSVYAKYSFGQYVRGNTEVVIRRAADGYQYSKDTFNNVYEPKVVTKNLKQMGVQTLDEVKLEAFVIFTEPTSGMHFNKTVPFYAHADEQSRLVPVHAEKFLPGFPFTLKVFIYDWKNVQLMSHFEKIELMYSYKLTNGSTGTISSLGQLKNGVFVNEFVVPMEYTDLSVNVKFPNSQPYSKTIEKGTVNVGINSLIVSHKPTYPNLYDTVKIFVTSDEPLNNIIYTTITRYGTSETKQINCNGNVLCNFEIQVSEEMMPHSTVMVYDVRSQQKIFQGHTEIETDNLGRNHLTVELETTKAKTKEEINVTFKTKAKSKIYMLAFDKRLTFLRDGNDITKDDVISSVADYDGENKILIDDMAKWSVCTPEEVVRVQSGRTYVVNQGGTDTYYPDEKDDDMGLYQQGLPNPDLPPSKDGLLREYFPETWIFETIEVGSKSTIEKAYTTPDSMTTWLISAFSVHNDHGIALSPRQDLIVMEEFFVELNLPYSIRYTEVLKLDILVFNYVDTKDTITVDLKLNNINDEMEFQFVDYSADCKPSYHDGSVASTKVTVGPNGVSTSHFYIRSHPLNNQFDGKKQKLMTLDVEATAKSASGRTYRDHMQKKLIVDPVGIKVYMVLSDFFKLEGGTTTPHIQEANFTQDLSNTDVIMTGDFLTDTMNLEKELTLYTSDCLEQGTVKFKRNVDTFHYLDVKGKNPSKSHFTEQYQSMLKKQAVGYSYGDRASFRANLGNIYATAMTVGAVPVDKKVVFENLDKVRDQQESNGTFTHDNFNFYYGFANQKDADFIYTERYFAAAYCLVPVVRHRKFMDGRYDNFIDKGFRYLDKVENRLQVKRNGLSIAAYVYALDNQPAKAENLLKDIEKAYIHHEDNKRCYKINENDGDCDVRHTSYVALTYLTLNDLVKAEPIIYYLMSKKQGYDLSVDTRYLSVVTEPIADMGVLLNVGDTNLKITVQNQGAYKQDFFIDNGNSDKPQSVALPQGSETVSSVISGRGYCTISVIFERLVIVPMVDKSFSLSLTTRKESSSPVTNVIKVCATYNQQTGMKPILVNVIYEVEMPSGYIFLEHKAADNSNNKIKEVTTRRQNTVVNLFYEDFENDINYCVELKATQKYAVNEAVNAGVKVYDYNNKENVAVDFYKFSSEGC